MVKHIVLYTFKEGVNKEEAVQIVAEALEPLVGKIEGLNWLEICQAYQGGMDYALYSEFESREALAAYATHPLHEEAKAKFFHLLDNRYCAPSPQLTLKPPRQVQGRKGSKRLTGALFICNSLHSVVHIS